MSEQLPTRFDPKAIEQKWYDFWVERRYFEPRGDGKPFCIVIPPPNVTGILHMGHALNNTLQDILTRRARMQGRRALWLPGTDHAGIATQIKVEQALHAEGKRKEDLGREKFVERMWDWKERHGGTIIRQLKTLGCSCDWSRERFTLDPGLSRAVRVAFKKLYDADLIYRENYLVNWCPKLQTALSDDEVEYKEIHGHLWHIKYPIEGDAEFVQVATTRPETMLGDTAVAVNPDDARYKHLIGKTAILPLMNRAIPIIADALVDPAFGTGMVKVTPAHDPNDFEMGRRHALEFINILTPDGHINENAGPYAGLDRWQCRKKVVADLQAQRLLVKIEDHVHQVGHHDRTGDVVEPYLTRQWFVKMRPLAEPALEAVRGGRIRITPKTWENTYFHWLENVRDWCISRQLWWGHRIPVWYCEECGHLNVPACPEPAEGAEGAEGVEGVEGVERAEGKDDEPACCEKCRSTRLRQDPDVLDTWFSSALWPLSTLGWPDETDDLKTFYPTDVLVTAHEILFFWVARMIMMGLRLRGDVPFRDVYIHSMIFDEVTRKKMSKSLGNIIDPIEMIEKYGADAVRFTLCAITVTGPVMYLSEKRFVGYRNFTNKVYNASRFVLMNTGVEREKVFEADDKGDLHVDLKDVGGLSAQDLAAGLDKERLETEDKWILSTLQRTINQVNAAYESFSFDQIAHHIYQFLWSQYCDWYLELVKPRLYVGDSPTEEQQASRRNAQRVLVIVLDHILRLAQPLMPFLTEELWQKLRERYAAPPIWSASAERSGDVSSSRFSGREGADDAWIRPLKRGLHTSGDGALDSPVRDTLEALQFESIVIAPWMEAGDRDWINDQEEKDAALVQEAVDCLRNVRGELNIPPKAAAEVYVNGPVEAVEHLKAHARWFRALVPISNLKFGVAVAPGRFCSTGVVHDISIAVVVPESLLEAERARVNKEIARLESDVARLRQKLGSESFVAKAPEAVVQKERVKLSRAEAELAQLKGKRSAIK